eukprot:2994492-Prymnesium_polylepis.1
MRLRSTRHPRSHSPRRARRHTRRSRRWSCVRTAWPRRRRSTRAPIVELLKDAQAEALLASRGVVPPPTAPAFGRATATPVELAIPTDHRASATAAQREGGIVRGISRFIGRRGEAVAT